MFKILKNFFDFCSPADRKRFYASIVLSLFQAIFEALKIPAIACMVSALLENKVTAQTCFTCLGIMAVSIIGSGIVKSKATMLQTEGGYGTCAEKRMKLPMSVMSRFFPTVLEEFATINTAMRMREIRLGGRNAGKLLEYRLIPLMVCSVNIGSELSAAALTRGLGTKVRRTNICRIGFRALDIIVLLMIFSVYGLLILGRVGVIR